MNPEKGLLKTKNDIYNLAESKDTRVYVLPYLSMADVNVYQSVNNFPEWDFWQSQKYNNGENFGTLDFIDKNDLYLRSDSGEILHYYGGTNSSRPLFDSRNPIVQDYLIKHVSDIVNAGYDGVFSDNWWRTKYTGDMSKLTQAEFEKIQEGWNTIGKGIQNNIGDKILVGNSPQYDAFGSRDVVMLEDRIDDVVGSGDKSIASYFKYSENARASNQVSQDTYWDEAQGPFETFRIPINLLTDNILGIGSVTKGGTDVTEFILPLRTLGEIGYPIGNKVAVQGTQTGTFDNLDNFSLERAVYKRDYSNGLVFLNDTLTPQTVTLPKGQWLRSDGTVFSEGDFITLDSTRGWVFKKLGEEQSIVMDAGGIDLVNSSISYNLGKYIENLNLTGTQDINAVGNELNNVINGNTANNIIEGKTGNDLLQGGAGNDTYVFNIGDGQDTINDISGIDKLKFSGNITKEDLTFTKEDKNIVISLKNTTDKITLQNWTDGNKIETIEFSNNLNLTSQDIEKTVGIGKEPPPSTITPTLTGTDANDSLSGNNGDDIYLAKKGYDRIKDYSGNDVYLFDKGDNWDTITDTSGSDSIIFGQNITKNDVKITKDGNNVQFAINGTNDGITVVDWYQNPKFVIEKVQFNDGSFLSNNDINAIIQGISSFTASSETQISLTPSTTTNQNALPELVSS
jgi:Ca2+-binding RTX toxin-like protein